VVDAVDLDFYFDPSCGWAWRTSIWIRRVAKERPINVNWKLFSLAYVNAPDDYKDDPSVNHVNGMVIERVIAMARRKAGNDVVDRLYIAYGNARHGREENYMDPTIQARCLDEAGLPRSIYDEALADDSTLDEVKSETQLAMDTVGAFGVPTLALVGSSLGVFGPVIQPAPAGQEALSLWDTTLATLKQTYFYEMKRTRVRYGQPAFAD
jgi:2-hydroxychromene-2-carboxylate isomerase